ncbi:calcium-binding protein [Teichococcus vastitatis]|uniref:Calcium-binding protein n=1 Tax=Teichococcus vastitatis TaxID=2307076 RepID=A0ABS9W3J6_9PROT|nr:calcium-binding protein [Pseudoroseomonas vastitatis]MCI0753859.1 calcium-binding protein [Pseudoroseomonas vastitatis]
MPHWGEDHGWARGYSARGAGRDLRSDPAWGGKDALSWSWPLGTLLTKPEARDAPMVVSMATNADAVGHDTLAAVDVALRIVDRGMVTLALGSVKAIGSASDPQGEGTYAGAMSDLSVTGADVALSRTRTDTGSGVSGGKAWSSETATTTFLALDLDGIQPLFGPINRHSQQDGSIRTPPSVQGNLATYDVDAKVYGSATYVDVTADALALEDRYSTVASIVLGSADTAPRPGAERDAFRVGAFWNDRINTGSGDDWILGLTGNDVIQSGGGADTVSAGWGDDTVRSGAGDDWVFGGEGRDTIDLGEGNNLAYGGNGGDRITAGGGHDALSGGGGDDQLSAGGGKNSFLLGSVSGAVDGNDTYSAGSGADYYLLAGPFGRDRVSGFRAAEGDRLVGYEGDWGSEGGLRSLNGNGLSLQRGSADARDLVVSVKTGWTTSTLTLDDFFVLNGAYGNTPSRGVLSDDAALAILRGIVVDGDTHSEATLRMDQFIMGDLLQILG